MRDGSENGKCLAWYACTEHVSDYYPHKQEDSPGRACRPLGRPEKPTRIVSRTWPRSPADLEGENVGFINKLELALKYVSR